LETVQCPVCLGRDGLTCTSMPRKGDSSAYRCQGCGDFSITRTALVNSFNERSARLTDAQRGTLRHRLRLASDTGSPITIESQWIEWFEQNARLVSIRDQANMLISLIGDEMNTSGRPFMLNAAKIAPLIGSVDQAQVQLLVQELTERGLIRSNGQGALPTTDGSRAKNLPLYSLTFDGWDLHETQRKGETAGRFGFVAMKFHDPVLDDLLNNHLKPLVLRALGYELVNMLDLAQAGLIDNIMRTKIKGAAFVLADLTHDNYGAYWEAGYAEGLGKPVIYLCERKKFDAAKTHFDTNHCTTVMWDSEDKTSMDENLISTIKRSLDLG